MKKYRLKINKFERPYTCEPYNKDYYFNLFNIWTYTYIENLYITVLFSVLLVIISFTILYIKYKDKEGVMIEIEK